MLELEQGLEGLGLTLGESGDRERMCVFVRAVDPGGAAGRDGRIAVGDELLEVRGWCLGREGGAMFCVCVDFLNLLSFFFGVL